MEGKYLMIKFVVSHLSGNGGTETVLVPVLNHFAKNNSVELVIFGAPDNDYWLSKLNSNIKVRIINYSGKFSKLLSFTQEAFSIKKNDLLISLSPSFIKLSSLLRKAKLSNFKIISWIHFSLVDQDLFNPHDITYADYHLAISNKIKKQLVSLGVAEKNIAVIYNPIKQERIWHSQQHDGVNIAYIGRSSFKGQKNLKELFDGLKNSSNTNLFIVGNGSKEEIAKCKNYIAKNQITSKVTWAGWQKDPWHYLEDKNIDGIILTSKFEGLPMVFLESISRGVPVISSQFDGYDDVVKEKINGFSYEPGNIDKLTKAIAKIKDIKDKKKIQNSINEFYNDNYFAKLDNVIKEIY